MVIGLQAARDVTEFEDMLEDAVTASDDRIGSAGVPVLCDLHRPFVLRRSWEEATGAVRPLNPPAQSFQEQVQ